MGHAFFSLLGNGVFILVEKPTEKPVSDNSLTSKISEYTLSFKLWFHNKELESISIMENNPDFNKVSDKIHFFELKNPAMKPL